MDEIKTLTAWLAALVPVAAAPRAILLLLSVSADDEQASLNRRKLKHLFCFVILAEAASGLLNVFSHYFT